MKTTLFVSISSLAIDKKTHSYIKQSFKLNLKLHNISKKTSLRPR